MAEANDGAAPWSIYNGREPLETFLETNRPSVLNVKETSWIYVENEQEDGDQEDEEGGQEGEDEDRQDQTEEEEKLQSLLEEQEDEDESRQLGVRQHDGILKRYGIMREWKYLLTDIKKSKNMKIKAYDTLKELALKYEYTTGKWMLFEASKYIDDLWFTVAKAVVAGKLGCSAKVSPTKLAEEKHVICVYTTDFTNEDDVRRVEKGLRDLGIYRKMSYKADIYTILGIYIDNDLGICPSIYYSEAVKMPHDKVEGYNRREENRPQRKVDQHKEAISYDGEESIGSFLERHRPSEIRSSESPWISVSYRHIEQNDGPDMQLIEDEWRELQKKEGMKLFAAEFLRDLAVKYRYTSGKWMVFTNSYEVDGLWFSVAKAVIAGRLGNKAKVSTKKANGDHVIYVYTEDFTNERDVKRVERSLRNAGIRTWMTYKPDIYTSLGISAKNELGISPTLFTSKPSNHRSGHK